MSPMRERTYYNYHEETVDMSDHSWQRHAQRLSHLDATEKAQVKERAIEAAEKSKGHTGVKVMAHDQGDVWAVVAGRTVKTIITTAHGQHLRETSPCNKYYIRPEAR